MPRSLGFEERCLRLIYTLKNTHRWGGLKKRTQEENVLEHMFKQVQLTVETIVLEPALSFKEKFLVLLVTTIHDHGERGYKINREKIRFDRPFHVKNGRWKNHHQAIERKRFHAFLKLSEMKAQAKAKMVAYLAQAYEIQYRKNKLGKYFSALEQLGYVAHALWELKQGNPLFVKVLFQHCANLEKAAVEFSSIECQYAVMRPKVQKYLRKEKAMADGIRCKNCGRQETEHVAEQSLIKPEEILLGYHYCVLDCNFSGIGFDGERRSLGKYRQTIHQLARARKTRLACASRSHNRP